MPRKLKPFDMKYKNWDIRVTNIRQFPEKIFKLTHNMYQYKLICKKNGTRYETKTLKIEANDKQDLENQIRLNLHLSNF